MKDCGQLNNLFKKEIKKIMKKSMSELLKYDPEFFNIF